MKLKSVYKLIKSKNFTSIELFPISKKDDFWAHGISFYSEKMLTDTVDFNINIIHLSFSCESEVSSTGYELYISDEDYEKLKKLKTSKDLKFGGFYGK